MLLSILGNALLITVMYKNANQRSRTPSKYFIFSMTYSDVFLTVYAVPALSTLHIVSSGLSRKSQASCFADYYSLLVKCQSPLEVWL